jgi:superkiller protein 3
LAATRIKPDDRTAWQGLISLYDKQGGSKLDPYYDAVVQLGKIFADKYVVVMSAYATSKSN